MAIRDDGPFTFSELAEINMSQLRGETNTEISKRLGFTRGRFDRGLMKSGVFPSGILAPVGRPHTMQALHRAWATILAAERAGCVDAVVGAAEEALRAHGG